MLYFISPKLRKLNSSNVSVSADSQPGTSEESIPNELALPLEKKNNFEQLTMSNTTNEIIAPATNSSQVINMIKSK